MEASMDAAYIKKLHEKTKEAIELKAGRKATSMNKHRKKVLFEPRDLVWIHLCKDCFAQQRKSKFLPRGDGPFHVLEKTMTINTRLIFLQVMVWATPSMLLISHHSQVKTLQSQG